MSARRCRSWRIRGWWPRRCSWPAWHATVGKWHCHRKDGRDAYAWHVVQWYAWRDST